MTMAGSCNNGEEKARENAMRTRRHRCRIESSPVREVRQRREGEEELHPAKNENATSGHPVDRADLDFGGK